MKKQLYYFTFTIAVLIAITTACKKDNNEPCIKLLKTASLQMSSNSGSAKLLVSYTYDDQKRVKEIGISAVDTNGTTMLFSRLDYSYNMDNKINKIRTIEGNQYTNSYFTYNNIGEITQIVYESETDSDTAYITPFGAGYRYTLDANTFSFKASYSSNTINEIWHSPTEYIKFKYDESIKSSLDNLSVPIGIPSLFSSTSESSLLMLAIFPNIFNAGIIKEIESSSSVILYTNEKDNDGYIKKTSALLESEFLTITYTYQ